MMDSRKTPQGETMLGIPLRVNPAALKRLSDSLAASADKEIQITLVFKSQRLKATYPGGEIEVAKLNPDLTPSKIFAVLMFYRPGSEVGKFELDQHGIKVKNIAEVIRKVGLFKHQVFRELFFSIYERDEVLLNPSIQLDQHKWNSILKTIGKSSEKINSH